MVRAVICPSILNADLANLAPECRKLLSAGADWLHLDVMDGCFVPNLSFGAPLVASLRKALGADPFFDVHLMVADPKFWVKDMAAAGASQYTFHWEAAHAKGGDQEVLDVIKSIRDHGMKVGLSVKPKTSVEKILQFADKIDTALIMTVEPGFGGQKFMSDMMEKVRALRLAHPPMNIQVDGGITPANINESAITGANAIVSGTGVIKATDQAVAIDTMRKAVEKALQAAK